MANRQEQYNTYSHHPEPNRVNNVGFHYAPSPYEGGPSPISTGHYDSPSCEDGPSPMSTGREDGGDLFLNSASPASSSQSPMLANGGLATQNLQGAMTPAIVGEGLFDLNSNTIPYYNDFHDNPLFNDFHDHPLFPSSECHNPNGYVGKLPRTCIASSVSFTAIQHLRPLPLDPSPPRLGHLLRWHFTPALLPTMCRFSLPLRKRWSSACLFKLLLGLLGLLGLVMASHATKRRLLTCLTQTKVGYMQSH